MKESVRSAVKSASASSKSKVFLLWDELGLTLVNFPKEAKKELTFTTKELVQDGFKKKTVRKRVQCFEHARVAGISVIKTHQGFWRRMLRWAMACGLDWELMDLRTADLLPLPKLGMMKGFRFSQKELLTKALSFNCSGVIKAPTRWGKSTLMINMLRAYAGVQTVVLMPGSDLLRQFTDELRAALPGREVKLIGAGSTVKFQSEDITVCSMDSMHLLDPGPVRLVIVDECFTPDVEILTSDGFVRFDELDPETPCAQYDLNDDSISFVRPDQYICKDYSGEMITLKSKKLCDLSMTPGHELVLKERGGWFKKSVSEAKLRYTVRMPVAGRSKQEGAGELTAREQLMLVIQADGSLHHTRADGTTAWSFSFSKPRKIEAFLKLMKEGGFVWSEVKGDLGRKLNPARRFMVKNLHKASKLLSDHFSLDSMSFAKARNIVSAAMQWDGHKHSPTSWYYSCTVKENVDFLQCVCVLGGYKSNLTVEVDHRSERFSNVYRLFIAVEQTTVSTQNLSRTPTPYSGKVYCVRVPTGAIVVRRNGKPVVTGNCHAIIAESRCEHLPKFSYARIYALGATPTGRYDGWDFLLEGLVGPILAERTFREGVEEGAICPIKVMMINWPLGAVPGERDRVYKQMVYQNELFGKYIRYLSDKVIPSDWQTLFFIKTEKQADFLQDWIGRDVSVAMAKKLTSKQRKEMAERVKKNHIQRVLCSDIYVQGVTFHEIMCLVNCGGGGASTSTIQKPGRLAEIRPGKNCGLMIDFLFCLKNHGMPGESNPNLGKGIMALCRESQARLAAYKEIGYDVHVVGRAEAEEWLLKQNITPPTG